MRSAALQRAPAARDACGALVRAQLAAPAGPAAAEELLLRVAVERAAAGSEIATDRPFECCPTACIVRRLGELVEI